MSDQTGQPTPPESVQPLTEEEIEQEKAEAAALADLTKWDSFGRKRKTDPGAA
jgi:hypothetical protein